MGNKKNSELVSYKITENGNELVLVWGNEGNHESVFHAKWLRFRCQCDECHPGLIPGCWKNRIREFSDDLRIDDVEFDENENKLNITFEKEIVEGHVCKHDIDWLRSQCYCDNCLERKLSQIDVISCHNNSIRKKGRFIPEIDWLDYETNKDQWTFQWMDHIFKTGMCFVKNAPSGEELKQAGNILGDLMITIFVEDRNNPNAVFDYLSNKNEGESIVNGGTQTGPMALHQDYAYHEPLANHIGLHKCESFDECIEGGGSVIIDAFEAAEVLRSESPEHFKALSEIPIIFRYTDECGKTWCLQKPNIDVDYYGKITAVNWNGDFSPELQVRGKDVDRYYRGYKAFLEILDNREELKYRFKHTPGTMFCFNNVRMVHTREGFVANGGWRYIVCSCVNTINMKANYTGLAKKLGIDIAPPKIGNGSSF